MPQNLNSILPSWPIPSGKTKKWKFGIILLHWCLKRRSVTGTDPVRNLSLSEKRTRSATCNGSKKRTGQACRIRPGSVCHWTPLYPYILPSPASPEVQIDGYSKNMDNYLGEDQDKTPRNCVTPARMCWPSVSTYIVVWPLALTKFLDPPLGYTYIA
jgi:hypothetical protein